MSHDLDLIGGHNELEELPECNIQPFSNMDGQPPVNALHVPLIMDSAIEDTDIGMEKDFIPLAALKPTKISDELENLCKEKKKNGERLLVIPKICVNDDEWCGYISSNDSAGAEKWFDKNYAPKIIDYAEKAKNYCDMFFIGDSLKGLTQIRDNEGNYPIVSKFCTLIDKVRKILPNDTKIIYSANYGEYSFCHGGSRPMDEIWTHPEIYGVGINYEVKSDKIINSQEDFNKIMTSGEDIDYYFDKKDGKKISLEKMPHAQLRNLEYWNENDHYDYHPNTGKNEGTGWSARLKKFVFTGFTLIQNLTNNQPSENNELSDNKANSEDYAKKLSNYWKCYMEQNKNFINKEFSTDRVYVRT